MGAARRPALLLVAERAPGHGARPGRPRRRRDRRGGRCRAGRPSPPPRGRRRRCRRRARRARARSARLALHARGLHGPAPRPDRRPAAAAREVGLGTLLAAKAPVTAELAGPGEIDFIAGGATQLASFGRARHFVADWDGRPAAYATLYSDGVTAQVEDVATQAPARGRGLARAVVQHAVDVAQAEDHELVFLVADVDDWPRALYERLGFDPIGCCWAFVLQA
ncbi:MAG: GNAT family N-acetyltransferase [Solirubrobacteraceae bacterium]